jgi:hypothetical protein
MGPGVPREVNKQLVCVCANEFGGAVDRGEYRKATGAFSQILTTAWFVATLFIGLGWTVTQFTAP